LGAYRPRLVFLEKEVVLRQEEIGTSGEGQRELQRVNESEKKKLQYERAHHDVREKPQD
jgi:hypothetical protein